MTRLEFPSAVKGACLAAFLALPLPALAQEFETPTAEAFIDLLRALEGATQKPRLIVLQGVATATTMPNGTVFASVSGTTKRDGGSGADGSIAFGLGLGDAHQSIGAQITVNVTSVHPSDFGDSGSLSLKFSRALPAVFGNTSVGITFDNLAPWGDSTATNVKASLAVTTARQISIAGRNAVPLLLNFGIASETSYRDDWTPFGAVGFGLSENLSMTLGHNGDYAVLGVTTRLSSFDNVSLSAGLQDVFDQRDARRLTITASIAFNDLFR